MKTKTTRKFLRECYKIINTGYANVQNLLRLEDPDYYCTRAEGWAFDAYIFGDYAILNGYACIGKYKGTDIMRKYDDKAREIVDKYPWDASYEDTRETLRSLIDDFIKEMTE